MIKPFRGIQLNKSHLLARGIVCLFLFNEGTGDFLQDLSSSKNNGILKEMNLSNVWEGDTDGLTVHADGNNDYILINTKNGFDQNQGTVEILIKSDVQTSGNSVIWQWTDVARFYSTGDGIGIGTTSAGGLMFRGSNDSSGGQVFNITRGEKLQANTWHYIVGTWKDGEQKLYLDGILLTSDNETITGNIDIANDNSYILGYTDSVEHTNGRIGFFALRNIAISDDEVIQRYFNLYEIFQSKTPAIFGGVLPSRIPSGILLTSPHKYYSGNMKFHICGLDFMWKNNQLVETSGGNSKYILKNNVLELV